MDVKYIKLEAVLQYLFVYLVLILGLVRGDGQCRYVSDYRTARGTAVSQGYCVGELNCLHNKAEIRISWSLPTKLNAIDFYICLSGVKIQGQERQYRSCRGVNKTTTSHEIHSNSTKPILDFKTYYNVTINGRCNSTAAFQISKECTKGYASVTPTKLSNTIGKRTINTIKRTTSTKRANIHTISTAATTISREIKRGYTGTSVNVNRKIQATGQINGKKTSEGQDLGAKGNQNTKAENQNWIIGLCAAGGIVIVVVVIFIVCIKRRKQNKQGTQNENKQQNGSESNRFEEEDTYNHLSHDHHILNNERGRRRNYLTNDDVEEEDTYNHMSLRYHDNKGTTEAALQDTYSHITIAKEDSANRKQISTQSAGNYDDISFKDEGEKEQGDEGRGEGGQSGSNHDKSNTSVPVDVHKVINADVPSTSENETGTEPNRTEGPKGDLYTEVAIKN